MSIKEMTNTELVAHVRKCVEQGWCEDLELLLAERIEQLEERHGWHNIKDSKPPKNVYYETFSKRGEVYWRYYTLP
jgi:hypothetical protein